MKSPKFPLVSRAASYTGKSPWPIGYIHNTLLRFLNPQLYFVDICLVQTILIPSLLPSPRRPCDLVWIHPRQPPERSSGLGPSLLALRAVANPETRIVEIFGVWLLG